MVVKRTSEIDFDLFLLLGLPGIIGLSAFFLNHEKFFLTLQLGLAIAIYQLLTFHLRRVYGLNGIRILSFASIMFISYTLLIAIPSIYIYTIKDISPKVNFWYAVLSFYIIIPISYHFSNIFWMINIEKIYQLYSKKLVKTWYDNLLYDLLRMLFYLCLFIMINYIIRVDVIPLFELLSNPTAYLDAFVMREESRKLLQVSIFERYLFSWQVEIFFPLGIAGSAFLTFTYRKKKYLRLFIAFIILGIFNNSLSIAKAPTAAISLVLLSFFFLKHQKLSIKFILFSMIIILAFPFFVIYFVSIPEIRQFDNLLINGLLYRIFVVPAEVLYQYFRIFPEYHDFLGGRSTSIFSWLNSDGGFKTANYVAQVWWRNPFTTGFGNAIYLGNFWADFSWSGVIGSSFFLGVVIHYLYFNILELVNYHKTGLYYLFVCSLVPLFSFYFISVSYTVFFLTKGLVVIFGLLFLFKIKNHKTKNLQYA